jgi:predicted transcriptional regulator YheO
LESVDAMGTDVVVLVAESIGSIYTDVVEVVVHGIADDDDAGA